MFILVGEPIAPGPNPPFISCACCKKYCVLRSPLVFFYDWYEKTVGENAKRKRRCSTPSSLLVCFQALAGEKETLSAACWGHSPWPIMSVRDGAATTATSAGGGTGGVGPASPNNDHDARSYMLQIYPRLAAQSTTCCNLRWVYVPSLPPPPFSSPGLPQDHQRHPTQLKAEIDHT